MEKRPYVVVIEQRNCSDEAAYDHAIDLWLADNYRTVYRHGRHSKSAFVVLQDKEFKEDKE